MVNCGLYYFTEHAIIGVTVVKKNKGSDSLLAENIESSKSTAGGSEDCKATQQ